MAVRRLKKTMSDSILTEAKEMQPELSKIRRDLHQIPELGLHLPKTVAYVTGKLDELGIPYEVLDDISCVVATIGQGGRCILLRGDMDALPECEESGEAFASTNGNMHACGHDMHATSLLGAARLLKERESELNGTVKLFFQSAEEIFAGCDAAIKEGVLDGVDAAFAQHVFAACPTGTVLYGETALSSAYGFKITIEGIGAHGSTPELGVDPINAGVHIYEGLQELIAREVSAFSSATLTIGHFEAGSASNIIPARAVLEGSLRTFDNDVRLKLIKRISEIAESVGKAYRCAVTVDVLYDVPPLICDKTLLDKVVVSASALGGGLTIAPALKAMGSEDFAFCCDKVPTAFFGIGAGVEDKSAWVAQHNPKIRFNEQALPIAAAIYCKAAMDYLKNA